MGVIPVSFLRLDLARQQTELRISQRLDLGDLAAAFGPSLVESPHQFARALVVHRARNRSTPAASEGRAPAVPREGATAR